MFSCSAFDGNVCNLQSSVVKSVNPWKSYIMIQLKNNGTCYKIKCLVLVEVNIFQLQFVNSKI